MFVFMMVISIIGAFISTILFFSSFGADGDLTYTFSALGSLIAFIINIILFAKLTEMETDIKELQDKLEKKDKADNKSSNDETTNALNPKENEGEEQKAEEAQAEQPLEESNPEQTEEKESDGSGNKEDAE